MVSGQEYTVQADGNLDFVTTGSVYIESVTITPGATDDTPTGIATTSREQHSEQVYNLRGQQIASPTKGLYIVNRRIELRK